MHCLVDLYQAHLNWSDSCERGNPYMVQSDLSPLGIQVSERALRDQRPYPSRNTFENSLGTSIFETIKTSDRDNTELFPYLVCLVATLKHLLCRVNSLLIHGQELKRTSTNALTMQLGRILDKYIFSSLKNSRSGKPDTITRDHKEPLNRLRIDFIVNNTLPDGEGPSSIARRPPISGSEKFTDVWHCFIMVFAGHSLANVLRSLRPPYQASRW